MTPEAITAIRMRDYFACEDNFCKTKNLPSRLMQGMHREETPRFTIVIPTYKKPELLKAAVESALAQPGKDYQILVVDDVPGGDPATGAALSALADERLVYYANQVNLGLFANWNRCFELAQSEWVVMLHDDDLLTADYLPWMRSALRAAKDADLIAAQHSSYPIPAEGETLDLAALCAPAKEKAPHSLRPLSKGQLQFGPGIVWQGSCIRKSAFMEMGGAQLGTRMVGDYPIGAYYTQDYCMMVRFAHRYRCYRLPRSLYRVGLGQNSSRNVQEWQDALVEQYWCSRFLARQHPVLQQIGITAAQVHIMELAEHYNSGQSYMGVEAGLDLSKLCRECAIDSLSIDFTMRMADKAWKLYDKFRLFMTHFWDKRLTAPKRGDAE